MDERGKQSIKLNLPNITKMGKAKFLFYCLSDLEITLINQIENLQTYKTAYKIPAVKWQSMFPPFHSGELFLALTYEEKWWLVYVTESISL